MILNNSIRTALTLGTLLLIVACETGRGRSDTAEAAPAPAAVSVAEVLVQPLTEWDEFTGRLEAPESVELRARISGHLQTVAFEEGDIVQRGDLLFKIDDRSLRAEVERLKAELADVKSKRDLAETEFDRASRLVAKGAISRELMDNREAAYRQAVAQVQAISAAFEYAHLQLDYTEVRSPIDGRVSRALITEGNYIQAGQSVLTTVVSTSEIYAYFDADEQTYLKYARLAASGDRPSSRSVENPVFMALAGEQDFVHQGYIDFVDNAVNPATGTIRARAVFPNEDGLLIPGLFARLQLIGSATYKGVLIDDKAVGTDLDQKYVLVLEQDNSVSYRSVSLGEKTAGLRIVKSGLSAGDRIVVRGLHRVRPGSMVAPEQLAMATDAQQQTLARLQHRVDQGKAEQQLADSVIVASPENERNVAVFAGWTL
ncbi:MAG: efflux RND transporter periplasmic adaptor subunit [Pseudomonadota bacterium]